MNKPTLHQQKLPGLLWTVSNDVDDDVFKFTLINQTKLEHKAKLTTCQVR